MAITCVCVTGVLEDVINESANVKVTLGTNKSEYIARVVGVSCSRPLCQSQLSWFKTLAAENAPPVSEKVQHRSAVALRRASDLWLHAMVAGGC